MTPTQLSDIKREFEKWIQNKEPYWLLNTVNDKGETVKDGASIWFWFESKLQAVEREPRKLEEITIPKECWASEYTEDEHIYAIEEYVKSKLKAVEEETLAHIFKEGNAKNYTGMELIGKGIRKKYEELLTDEPKKEKVLNVYLPESSYDKNGKLKVARGFTIDDKHLKAMSGSIDGIKAETSPKSNKLGGSEVQEVKFDEIQKYPVKLYKTLKRKSNKLKNKDGKQ